VRGVVQVKDLFVSEIPSRLATGERREGASRKGAPLVMEAVQELKDITANVVDPKGELCSSDTTAHDEVRAVRTGLSYRQCGSSSHSLYVSFL
jgi:hypothetical protein